MSKSESLLQGEPTSARFGGKAFVLLAFAFGLGLGALIAVTSSGGQMMNDPSIDMAWQSSLAKPAQSMMPVKSLPVMQPPKAFSFIPSPRASANPEPLSRTTGIRTNALHNPSALAGSALSQKRIPDIRNALGLSPAQKCFYANKHASLCGNVVVLRPETALRAGSGNKVDFDAEEILKDLSERWDAVEDKTATILYASGAVLALYFANSIIATVNALPLLPGLFEAVGLGYSGWFAYRYLLTKSSRQELVADIDELKKKISS
eukprot:gnl/MRDRNA2_/MRDRNA2_59866_c0_seq1.p1 gnl/MRDRNA2_/MRDRNA2_59866_c0~~gnl/MRDRNA2_/MRDRNA2_59866_c0_seq1.p1  ORF type:complete len:263 (-),score=62.42 gnl/MRDRNA2_/MRDRNA2_59866_c0_seq1:123-911(-)